VADLVGFSRATGTIWMVPVVIFLVVAMIVAFASATAAPYVVYTFF
jgi:hypothetical protein